MSDEYEYGEEPDWRGEIEIPANLSPTSRNIVETLLQTVARPTRYEIWAPFACNPEQKFLLGVIYEGEGRYWYIEGQDGKFHTGDDAVHQMMENLEIKRQAMLNDEFNNLMEA